MSRCWTWIRTKTLTPVLAAVLIGFGLAAPQSVVACLCGGLSGGEVVFTGVVTEGLSRSILVREVFAGNDGVYTFNVESVSRGDPKDGRVYTPHGFGGCGRTFEIGATYRVHADAGDPDDRNRGRRAGAYLVSNQCMDGELLKPAGPVASIQSLAFSYEGIGLGVVGVGLMTGVGMHRWHRRRSDREPSATG